MLDAFKFVKGAVARKDYLPVLTHYQIKDSRVVGYNGTLALSAPVPLSIEACPNAIQMFNAISASTDQTVISQLPNGDLLVKSGPVRVTVPCTSDSFPDLSLAGSKVVFPFPIVPILKKLAPYISEDASRQWSRGILFRGQSAICTNNVVMVEYWLGAQTPVEIILPSGAVEEIVRIGEEPEYFDISETGLVAHYKGGRWLYSRLIDEAFPSTDRYFQGAPAYLPFPETLFPSLATIRPFLSKEGSVHLSPSLLSTHPPDCGGASVEVPGLDLRAKFSWQHLASLEAIATGIDWTSKPCAFKGERLRGVIMAMRP